jgi:sec-independent protein translocase protein TatB
MSLPDTIFILALALIVFGPKRLPEIGRKIGKIVGDLRRASNDFKFQIEEELRMSDESDRRKAAAAGLPPPNNVPTIMAPSTGEPVARAAVAAPASLTMGPEPPNPDANQDAAKAAING